MKKRLFSLLLALCMVLSLLPFGVSAAEIVESGTCGENLTWTLDADGLLTISGKGDMISSPWNYGEIKAVVIEPGVATIGADAFSN